MRCLGKVITHPNIINVAKYIHPITLEAATEVASNLRPDDRREIQEGHGHNPSQVLFAAASTDYSLAFKLPNGEWGGAFGVSPDNGIWMLCTPAIHQYPLTFARESKRFIDSRTEPYLWNVVDKRNTMHIKLLKKYMSENGKILPSRITNVSQKKQRELSLSIKRARNLALI